MTDYLKPMDKVAKIQAKIRRELDKAQPIAVLPIIAEAIKSIDMNLKTSRTAYMRIETGDFAERIRLEDVVPDKVEDLDSFNAIVRSIADAPTNELRIEMCRKTLTAIRAAIKRWQDKIDKFKQMSTMNGNTPNELAVAIEKTESFEYVIRSLRDRGDEISLAHDAARKAIENFLDRDSKKYEPMYARS